MDGIVQIISAHAQLWASLAAGLAVILSLGAVALLLARRDPVYQRIEALASGAKRSAAPAVGRTLKGLASWLLGHLALPALPRREWQISKVRKDLTVAGFGGPGAVRVFLGLKVFLCLLFPLLALFSPMALRVSGAVLGLVLVGAAWLGFFLPQLGVDILGKKRRTRITRELPDVLDLLVISVEAGLGLDAAVRRVAQETSLACPTLARELVLLSLEMSAGIPRHMALRNLAERCGVDDVTSLVTMLIQADRFGVSVGKSLRVHSDAVRTKRRQKLEEQAAKIPLKLLFPVLFMIFPAIMVVMAGPAIIRVSENLFK